MARAMKDSGIDWIGDIPADWEIFPIKYLCSYNDEVLQESTAPDFDFDYIEIGAVEFGKGIIEKQHVQFSDAPSRARRVVRENDIIVSTVRTYLKAVAQIPQSDTALIASTGFVVIRPRKVNPVFLMYAILSNAIISRIEAHSVGISYPAINASQVVRFKLPIPPLDEQQRIAAFLDGECARIDSVVEKTRASIEEYRKLKQSIITRAVIRGIRANRTLKHSGIDWLGYIPADWTLTKGKYLFRQRNEKGNSIELQLLSPTQKYGVIPQQMYDELSGMSAVKLSENVDYSTLKSIYEGDFCISLRSFQGGFEYSRYNGVVSPAYQVFYKIADLCNDYYRYMFKERGFISKMTSYTKTFRDGKSISFTDFANSLIPVPPIDEQERIAAYLDEKTAAIDSLVAKKNRLVSELASLKKSLIFEYVTGKKEVPT